MIGVTLNTVSGAILAGTGVFTCVLVLYVIWLLKRPKTGIWAADPDRIATAITADAIAEFKTDRIPPDDFDAYVRMQTLVVCDSAGLDPAIYDDVIIRCRRLVAAEKQFDDKGEIMFLIGGET